MYIIGCMSEGMQSDCNIMMFGGKDLTVILDWYITPSETLLFWIGI